MYIGEEDREVDVAGNIFAHRYARGWTQTELSRRSGVNHVTISKLETAQAFPRLGTLRKLAAAFGVEVRELLDESKRPTPPNKLKLGKIVAPEPKIQAAK